MTDLDHQLRAELSSVRARIELLTSALNAVVDRVKLLEEERVHSPAPAP